MAAKPTLEAIALLGEFGFEFVATDQVGEPTPGRIADRLSEVIALLEDANARGNPSAVHHATEKLKRLQQAIDVWSLLSAQLDDPQAANQGPAPPMQAPVPTSPPLVGTQARPAAARSTAPAPVPPVPAMQAPVPPMHVAPPPPPPAPPPAAPPPPAPSVQVAPTPPTQVAPPPEAEYPQPPAPDPSALDVERLEMAAAGTQQAFLQAIGQVPGTEDKK